MVDFIIAPTIFVKKKLLNAGIDEARIVHIQQPGKSAILDRLDKSAAKDNGACYEIEDTDPERNAKELLIKYRQAIGCVLFDKMVASR